MPRNAFLVGSIVGVGRHLQACVDNGKLLYVHGWLVVHQRSVLGLAETRTRYDPRHRYQLQYGAGYGFLRSTRQFYRKCIVQITNAQ
jgi:hypothetical protein